MAMSNEHICCNTSEDVLLTVALSAVATWSCVCAIQKEFAVNSYLVLMCLVLATRNEVGTKSIALTYMVS